MMPAITPSPGSGNPPAPSALPLRMGHVHTPEDGKTELAELASRYQDAAGWRKRAARIRAGILRGTGLDPLPRRCLLRPRIGEPRQHEGYVVENVALESLPGFIVTGTLYRPSLASGRGPGILLPHGHFRGPTGGRFQPEIQILAASFARAGAVVYVYDMVGWGESTQHPHLDSGALRLQLWNSIRALDWLESRDDVDPQKLAVTGASGGGTQTFLLTAVDDRIAATAPVVQVSAHFFGSCQCESSLPIHAGPEHLTNNVEIAAAAAPRPQLIVSDGEDWTQNVPEVEFPYIRRVYDLFGAADRVENVHLPEEGHDYGPSKAAAAIRFFGRQLGIDADFVLDAEGRPDASVVEIESPETMYCFTPKHPRPDNVPVGTKAIHQLLIEQQT